MQVEIAASKEELEELQRDEAAKTARAQRQAEIEQARARPLCAHMCSWSQRYNKMS
jgi:hypothetical protein